MNIHNEVDNKKPIISVIVPVYNTEKYFSRCMDSILCQTYDHLEIIVVSDRSPGNISELIKPYMAKDNRIKYIENEINQGVFIARLIGFEHSSGDYIVTIDSDDFLAGDFYRMLMQQALDMDADIVCGKMVNLDEIGRREYVKIFNEPDSQVLKGEDVFKEYMTHGSGKYFWVVVWNKLYRRSVWEKALPYFKKVNRHFLNCEDVYTTVVLHYFCQTYATVDYEGYFYSQNVDSITSIHGDYKKYYKNISDVCYALEQMKDFLLQVGKYERYAHFHKKWRDKEICLYNKKIRLSNLKSNDKKKLHNDLKELFQVDKIRTDKSSDHFFYWFEEDLQKERYELDDKIMGNHYDGIAFNVKDILLTQPTLDDCDIFLFLDQKYYSLLKEPSSFLFSAIRQFAEEELYRIHQTEDSVYESVTLDQVYHYMGLKFNIDAHLLNTMKTYELDWHIKHTQARKSGKRLLDLAKVTHKKIILIWNTLLPQETAKDILAHWGMSEMGDVFIASGGGSTKAEEDMLNKAFRTLNFSSEKWLYVVSKNDVILRSSSMQVDTCYYSSPIDSLLNIREDKHTGDGAALYKASSYIWFDLKHATHSLMVRSALGLVANKYFDNPLRRFSVRSDFNSDPYFMGYFPVGMHVLGICQWLIEEAISHGYKRVTFDSDEGELFKHVYDILSEAYEKAPKARTVSYRLVLQQQSELEDVLALPSVLDITHYSPKDVFHLFLNEKDDEKRVSTLKTKGLIFEAPFSSDAQFYDFINIVRACQLWEQDKTEDAIDLNGDEIVFCSQSYPIFERYLSKRHIPIYQIYSTNQGSHCYYSIPPMIGDDIRRLFYSSGMSVIKDSKTLSLEALNLYVTESYIKNQINAGVIDFVTDFANQFFDYLLDMKAGRHDLSLAFEVLINKSKEPDNRLFAFYSEKDINIHHKWRDLLLQYRFLASQNNSYEESVDYGFLYGRSKYHKALFYLIYKRGDFKRKFKHKFAHKPLMLAFLTWTYRFMRNIKNMNSKKMDMDKGD
ncbi:MAG: glycosyltransferase family 2 protein [Tissierellales bacterium]|nr:glycosyltransferase family 2 protein [Tissierellales bacterium]